MNYIKLKSSSDYSKSHPCQVKNIQKQANLSTRSRPTRSKSVIKPIISLVKPTQRVQKKRVPLKTFGFLRHFSYAK